MLFSFPDGGPKSPGALHPLQAVAAGKKSDWQLSDRIFFQPHHNLCHTESAIPPPKKKKKKKISIGLLIYI